MMDFEQSNYEISLQRPYYMSELVVPTPETIIIGKSTKAEVNSGRESSVTSCSVCSTTAESIASLKSTVDGSGELMQIQPSGKLVDCPYKAAGCTGAYISSNYFYLDFFLYKRLKPKCVLLWPI